MNQNRGKPLVAAAMATGLACVTVLLSDPGLLWATVLGDRICSGSSNGCCTTGCVNSSGTVYIGGFSFSYQSVNDTPAAYRFCEQLSGEQCNQNQVQCCKQEWFSNPNCEGSLGTTHKNADACDG